MQISSRTCVPSIQRFFQSDLEVVDSDDHVGQRVFVSFIFQGIYVLCVRLFPVIIPCLAQETLTLPSNSRLPPDGK